MNELRNKSIFILTCGVSFFLFPLMGHAQENQWEQLKRQFLNDRLYTPEEIDRWLEEKPSAFSQYDPLIGYRMHDRRFKEGIDGSWVTYNYDEFGARRRINYADKPCRISTFGSSFTDCEQVNDGETWQEYLAGHLMEPVRNFGVGGQTSYLSYLRMTREEEDSPSELIIVNLTPPYERQMYNWQATFYQKSEKHPCPPMPCLRVNSHKGTALEMPNPCPTEESLYNFCDLEWTYETLKNDFTLQIQVAKDAIAKGSAEPCYEPIERFAAEHGMTVEIDTPEKLAEVLDELFIQESVYATIRTVDLIEDYAEKHGKKVLYLLTYAPNEIEKRLESGARFDQDLVDHLNQKNLPHVDLMEAYLEDYGDSDLPFQEYQKLHFIGHPSPMGNFFVAYQIKDKVVELLDPKPTPYRTEKEAEAEQEKGPTFSFYGYPHQPWSFHKVFGHSYNQRVISGQIVDGAYASGAVSSIGDEEGNYGKATGDYDQADFKIVFLGSSYTDTVMTNHFQETLSDRLGKEVGMINYWRDSTGVQTHFDVAASVVDEKKPDLIVVAYNSLGYVFPRLYRPLVQQNDHFWYWYQSLDPDPEKVDPTRAYLQPFVLTDLVTEDWIERMKKAIEEGQTDLLRSDPVVLRMVEEYHTLMKYKEDMVAEHGPATMSVQLDDFSQDPQLVEAIRSVEKSQVPYLLVHVPTLPEIEKGEGAYIFEGLGVEPERALARAKSLEELTGKEVIHLIDYYPAESLKNPLDLVNGEKDWHPSGPGKKAMGEAFAKLIAEIQEEHQ